MARLPPHGLVTTTKYALSAGADGEFPYVLHLAAAQDGAAVVAAGSDYKVKVYGLSSAGLRFAAQLPGHTAGITGLSASATQPQLVFTSSQDGFARLWDLRTSGAALEYFVQEDKMWSHAVDAQDHVFAAGLNESVALWDLRAGGGQPPARVLFEQFYEPVDQLCFHPNGMLFSASEDGMVCGFDLNIADEDDVMTIAINQEQAVAQIGFYGPTGEFLTALTNIESFSVWDLQSQNRSVHFQDVRGAVSEAVGGAIDYTVGAHNDRQSGLLTMISGTIGGDLAIVNVEQSGFSLLGTLTGGHRNIVRSMLWDTARGLLLTGGEDGRICGWSPHPEQFASSPTARPSETGKIKRERQRAVGASPYARPPGHQQHQQHGKKV